MAGTAVRWTCAIGLGVGAMILLPPRSAWAEPPVPTETAAAAPPVPLLSPSLGPAAVEAARAAFIQQRLESGRGAARWWWYGWLTGFGAVVAAESIGAWQLRGPQYATLRPQLVVGALSAAIGLAGVLIMPWPSTWSSSASEPLAVSERRLHLISESESLGRSWLTHAAAVLVNGAGALVIGFAFHLPVDALLNFVVGMAVAEAQIFTHPTAGVQDEADYRLINPPPPTGDWAIHF